ncbi:MFS transporter-like protein [Cryomyces antarcticus]
MARFTLPFTASRLQITTYLFGVALFSISFLVFLNSSVSFVISDLIGQRHDVGDAVGTLGFADELVALVACAGWGVLSDRVGVRAVAVTGYAIVGVSLFLFVQAKNVYPQLLLARLLFSLGGAATSTMVTAILPTMTHIDLISRSSAEDEPRRSETSPRRDGTNGHAVTPSISSELTITPARYQSRSPSRQQSLGADAKKKGQRENSASTSQLAGLVGTFTGLGALLALGVFLPLPARFAKNGVSAGDAVADSYYVVGAVALAVCIFSLLGLRDLPGEEHKGWRTLIGRSKDQTASEAATETKHEVLSYGRLLIDAVALAFKEQNIGLGYLGGFVARASSVGISLFIPLFVNNYFIRSGLCEPGDREHLKESCRRAYTVAAELTGVSQLIALLCAPLFGWLAGRYTRFNIPLLLAAVAGMGGYISFALVKSPDPSSEDGSAGIFFIVALLGISQIGAIVCSLGLLGRGIQGSTPEIDIDTASRQQPQQYVAYTSTNGTPTAEQEDPEAESGETSALLPSHLRSPYPPIEASTRGHLKGSIAGVYSLAGGAGILLLTKLGGYLFDATSPGAPFVMLAVFNAILLLIGLGVGVATEIATRRRHTESF